MKSKLAPVEIVKASKGTLETWNPIQLLLDIRELLIGIARANKVQVTAVQTPKRSGHDYPKKAVNT